MWSDHLERVYRVKIQRLTPCNSATISLKVLLPKIVIKFDLLALSQTCIPWCVFSYDMSSREGWTNLEFTGALRFLINKI